MYGVTTGEMPAEQVIVESEVCSEEEVPSQIEMDSVSLSQVTEQLQVQAGTATDACTLRRRKQAGSTNQHHMQSACPAVLEDMYYDPEGETGEDPVRAQEIANCLKQQLQSGGTARQAALADFEKLAFTSQTSSRAAQMVLKEASEVSTTDAADLVKVFHGHVWNAIQSKHANYVVQQITEIMPVGHASFIVEELKGFGSQAMRHRFGCRVLCRILEHLASEDMHALELMEEILSDDMHELCRHPYGSYVVRHLLEFGLPEHKHRVALALGSDLIEFSKNEFGSHVVESALRHCSPEDHRRLARQLLCNQQQLLAVAGNRYGRYVVRALLVMPGEMKREAVEVLSPLQQQLKSSRYGKSALQALRAASMS
jgi:hypothetical protein